MKIRTIRKIIALAASAAIILSTAGAIDVQAKPSIHKTSYDISGRYMTQNGNNLERVEFDRNLYVEKYSRSFKYLSQKVISKKYLRPSGVKKSYSLDFGNFYSGKKYNFVCTVMNSKKTIRVVKFDKAWKYVDACDITLDSKADLSNGDMIEDNGILYISGLRYDTIKKKYSGNYGLIFLAVNINDMKYIGCLSSIYDTSASTFSDDYAYRFLVKSNGNLYSVFNTSGEKTGLSIGAIDISTFNSGDTNNTDIFSKTLTLQNTAHFDIVDGKGLSPAVSSDSHKRILVAERLSKKITVISVCTSLEKNSIKKVTINSKSNGGAPQLVKINDNKFLLAWEEDHIITSKAYYAKHYKGYSAVPIDSYSETHYIYIDANGKILSKEYKVRGECVKDYTSSTAIYSKGSIIWYSTDEETDTRPGQWKNQLPTFFKIKSNGKSVSKLVKK